MIPTERKHYRVIGIDPGSNMCGFSIIDWCFDTNRGIVQYANTVTRQDALMSHHLAHNASNNITRYIGYANHLKSLIEVYRPDTVVSEAPFMSRFAQAFRVLSEITSLLNYTTLTTNPFLCFNMVDPPTVKKVMGVNGNSGDKNLMLEALLNRYELSYVDDLDVRLFDEHTVDSICVCLWKLGTLM